MQVFHSRVDRKIVVTLYSLRRPAPLTQHLQLDSPLPKSLLLLKVVPPPERSSIQPQLHGGDFIFKSQHRASVRGQWRACAVCMKNSMDFHYDPQNLWLGCLNWACPRIKNIQLDRVVKTHTYTEWSDSALVLTCHSKIWWAANTQIRPINTEKAFSSDSLHQAHRCPRYPILFSHHCFIWSTSKHLLKLTFYSISINTWVRIHLETRILEDLKVKI